MIRGIRIILATLGLAIVCGVSPAAAYQHVGSKTWTIGNRDAGASATLTAGAANFSNATRAESYVETVGSIHLLGKTSRAVEFKATGQKVAGAGKVTYALKVAGYTVESGSKAVNTSWRWSKSISQTLVSASKTFAVAGIPVTVGGSVGGSANISLGFSFGVDDVVASGQAAAWSNGTAAGSVNAEVAKVGVEARLNLLHTTIDSTVGAGLRGWTGQATARLTPYDIRLVLASYYRSFSCRNWKCGFTWSAGPSLQLASFSGSSQSTVLLRR